MVTSPPHVKRREEAQTSHTHPTAPPSTPTVESPHLLYLTAGIMDGELTSAEVASMAALAAMDIKSKCPHPQQGGQWISAQYLQELLDMEALWAFQYISVELTVPS